MPLRLNASSRSEPIPIRRVATGDPRATSIALTAVDGSTVDHMDLSMSSSTSALTAGQSAGKLIRRERGTGLDEHRSVVVEEVQFDQPSLRSVLALRDPEGASQREKRLVFLGEL